MYRKIKDPEAYLKGIERVNAIRKYCIDNDINDFSTLYNRCSEEKPEWLTALQRPSVIQMLQRAFSCKELAAKRNEVMKKEGVNTRKARRVRCIETGEVFKSLTAAAAFAGVKNTRDISDVCRGLRKRIRGYRFEYVTENNND